MYISIHIYINGNFIKKKKNRNKKKLNVLFNRKYN